MEHKHFWDFLAIPGGLGAVIYTYIVPAFELANILLTFIVLLTSAIWGIYRAMEMRDKRILKKD